MVAGSRTKLEPEDPVGRDEAAVCCVWRGSILWKKADISGRNPLNSRVGWMRRGAGVATLFTPTLREGRLLLLLLAAEEEEERTPKVCWPAKVGREERRPATASLGNLENRWKT